MKLNSHNFLLSIYKTRPDDELQVSWEFPDYIHVLVTPFVYIAIEIEETKLYGERVNWSVASDIGNCGGSFTTLGAEAPNEIAFSDAIATEVWKDIVNGLLTIGVVIPSLY